MVQLPWFNSYVKGDKEMTMKRILVAALCMGLSLPLFADDKAKDAERLQQSGTVLKEIIDMPDKGLPHDLLNKAYCVLVYPSVKKFAIGIGGSYGRGAISCRSGADYTGPWSAPAMFALEGGSFGLQLGGEATDFVLLIMNEGGAQTVLKSKVKLGGDASVAAGPVGRTASAETDAALTAEILSYSRSHGVFGGLSLEGSTMRSDDSSNKSMYGKDLTATQIIHEGAVKPTPEATPYLNVLTTASPKRATGK